MFSLNVASTKIAGAIKRWKPNLNRQLPKFLRKVILRKVRLGAALYFQKGGAISVGVQLLIVWMRGFVWSVVLSLTNQPGDKKTLRRRSDWCFQANLVVLSKAFLLSLSPLPGCHYLWGYPSTNPIDCESHSFVRGQSLTLEFVMETRLSASVTNGPLLLDDV